MNPTDRSVPLLQTTWTDPVTGKQGFLVVHSLVSAIATGGIRMRAGCRLSEVADLARGMAVKTAVFELPVGGAKGGIDCDPKDPAARGVLQRFLQAMRPWLSAHWVTAEDLGVPQDLLDEVFREVGMDQSFHAAICRSPDPAATLRRVRDGLNAVVDGGYLLGDVIGGYGVAQACLGVADARLWEHAATTVVVQGIGTMGGSAAWYLHEAGMRVVAVADAVGTLVDPAGLDIPALLQLRDRYGEIDRQQVPAHIQRLPRGEVLSVEADILIPAAVSYAITPDAVMTLGARVVVEAANVATTDEAETMLAAREIPVIPDFVANAGAAAWAWWLLLGRVDADPQSSFTLLRHEMRTRIAPLISGWDTARVPPRQLALQLADQWTQLRPETDDGRLSLTIP